MIVVNRHIKILLIDGIHKMKVALCLHGIVGTDDKYGKGEKIINYKIGYKHFKNHVIDVNDRVDVFFHTWSVEREEKLKEIYDPVLYEAEEQPFFSDQPRRQATYCRWESFKKVINLVNSSGNEYDFVLVTRFDVAFLVDFEFEKYDNSKFYALGPPGPPLNNLSCINDFWFFANQKNMNKFANLFDFLDTNEYQPYIGSSHVLARKHLLETGLENNIEYIFKREWTGPIGKLASDTPLVRWHYLNKV